MGSLVYMKMMNNTKRKRRKWKLTKMNSISRQRIMGTKLQKDVESRKMKLVKRARYILGYL
jgi:hypothetical protein